jgi:outer membrane murein-binding lipoprotein Lpp
MYNTQFNNLKSIVDGLADDVTKANGGNKAAKVRIRQALQQIKKHAQEFRLVLTEPTTPLEQDL